MSEPPIDEPPYDDPFDESLDDDEFDAEGVDLALQIAHDVAGIGPAPRAYRKRRRYPQAEEMRTGSGADPRDPKTLGSAVTSFVGRKGWTKEIGLRTIVARWDTLVGATNAAHSHPERFADKVLYVRTESTTWATALRTMAPQVLAKLNEALGDGTVERIDIQGPAAPSWKHGIRSVRDGRGPRDTYG